MDRLPPHNLEAEQGVLGCIFLDPVTALSECQALFQAGEEVFYDPRHRAIYALLSRMFDSREAIDVITVQNRLKELGQLASVGGIAYLSELPDKAPSAANVTFYINIVRETFTKRRMLQHCVEYADRVYEGDEAFAPLLEDFEQSAMKVGGGMVQEKDVAIKDLVRKRLSFYEDCLTRGGGLLGLSTGYPDLDRMLDGMKGGDMIVLAARPSLGKTSLALNIVDHVAIAQKCPVGVFSLEMTSESLAGRLIACRAKVSERTLTGGVAMETDYPKVAHASSQIAAAPIFIDDTGGMTITQLRAKGRRMSQQHGIKLMVIDYLQLLRTAKRRDNRREEIDEISNGVKACAKELNIPVLAICQLNRELDKGVERKPRISDLRECLSVRDSLLFTDSGVQMNAASLMNTYSLNHSGAIAATESGSIPKKTVKVIRVRMRSGREIICTPSHPIMTDLGWVKVGDLTPEHAIGAVRKIEEPAGVQRIPEAKWIGWMLGNGSMTGYASPSFICSCAATATAFVHKTVELFGVKPKPHAHQCKSVFQYDITASTVRTPEGNPVKNWLMAHDLWGRKAPQKIIPQWFMEQADNDSIAELICGLIETDGSVFRHQSGRAVISFSTTSKMLAWQFIWCCARLGLFPRLDNGFMSAKATTPSYTVKFVDGTEIARLKAVLNIGGRKGDRLRGLPISNHGSNHGDRLGPWAANLVREICKKSHISWHQLGYRPQGKRISQRDLRTVLARLKALGACERDFRMKRLSWCLNDNIFWDRIASITPAGRAPVFDRHVAGTHNFVCNGIVVHNSGQIEQDADVIGLLYNSDIEAAKRNEKILPVNLLIGKQRAGPTGEVPLIFFKEFCRFESVSRVADVPPPPYKD